ncbi:MAG: hypothetical protein KF752_15605 [Pirellulaceae bacterium]|nr:hypothetical protein [Pirellulaceae bacterium]
MRILDTCLALPAMAACLLSAVQAQSVADSARLWDDCLRPAYRGTSDTVQLSGAEIGRQQLERLPTLLSARNFLIDDGRVTDEGLKFIVQSCPDLEHLRLRLSPIGDPGAVYLCKLRNLRILNLPQCRLTVAGIRKLAELRLLEEVRLGGGQIDDFALAELARLPSLKRLHLIGPSLSDQALDIIAETKGLQSFYLDDCNLDPAAWKTLSYRRPELHVHIDQPHRDRWKKADLAPE